MDKKNFVPEYRLIRGKTWYIEHITDDGARIRKTHNLNRIKNKSERLTQAKEILKELNSAYTPVPAKKNIPTVQEALNEAFAEKMESERENSRRSYRSLQNKFNAYCTATGLTDKPIIDFSHRQAVDFMKFVRIDKTLRNRTYNNILKHSRCIWNVIDVPNQTLVNPFTKIKVKRNEPKLRRAFDAAEKFIVIEAIKKKNYWLHLGCLLQYSCFIRPSELARLKFNNFDLVRGIISMAGFQTKNWKDDCVTIPEDLLKLLRQPVFTNNPANWLVFGRKLSPAPADQPISHSTMNKLHRKIMLELKESESVRDISGLTFYSWKDTGCTDAAEYLTPYELMTQLRHRTLEESMKYYHRKTVISAVKQHPLMIVKPGFVEDLL